MTETLRDRDSEGAVWRVSTVGRKRTVLVVENDAVVRLHPGGILCMFVQEVGDGLDMLVAMPSGRPVRGVVMVHVSPFRPLRFG